MTTGRDGSTGLHVGLPGAEAGQVVALARAYSEPVDATVARAVLTPPRAGARNGSR